MVTTTALQKSYRDPLDGTVIPRELLDRIVEENNSPQTLGELLSNLGIKVFDPQKVEDYKRDYKREKVEKDKIKAFWSSALLFLITSLLPLTVAAGVGILVWSSTTPSDGPLLFRILVPLYISVVVFICNVVFVGEIEDKGWFRTLERWQNMNQPIWDTSELTHHAGLPEEIIQLVNQIVEANEKHVPFPIGITFMVDHFQNDPDPFISVGVNGWGHRFYFAVWDERRGTTYFYRNSGKKR